MNLKKQDTKKDKQAESGRWGRRRRVKYLMAATMAASGASGYVRHSGDAGAEYTASCHAAALLRESRHIPYSRAQPGTDMPSVMQQHASK